MKLKTSHAHTRTHTHTHTHDTGQRLRESRCSLKRSDRPKPKKKTQKSRGMEAAQGVVLVPLLRVSRPRGDSAVTAPLCPGWWQSCWDERVLLLARPRLSISTCFPFAPSQGFLFFCHLGGRGRKGNPSESLSSPLPAGSSPRARFGPAQSSPPTEFPQGNITFRKTHPKPLRKTQKPPVPSKTPLHSPSHSSQPSQRAGGSQIRAIFAKNRESS